MDENMDMEILYNFQDNEKYTFYKSLLLQLSNKYFIYLFNKLHNEETEMFNKFLTYLKKIREHYLNHNYPNKNTKNEDRENNEDNEDIVDHEDREDYNEDNEDNEDIVDHEDVIHIKRSKLTIPSLNMIELSNPTYIIYKYVCVVFRINLIIYSDNNIETILNNKKYRNLLFYRKSISLNDIYYPLEIKNKK